MRLLRSDPHALTGVYALDAVDEAERARFERHLRRCQSCDHEVRGLRESAARLALAVVTAPPQTMKAGVLAAVASTRQLPPEVGHQAPPLLSAGARWTRLAAVPLAVACLAVAIVLGVLLGVSRHQLGTATARQREIAAVLTAPGARLVRVPTTVGGSASVVVAPHLHQFVFAASGLPALADRHVYELWIMEPDGRATRVALLPAANRGRTPPVLAAGLAADDRVGVTVEPVGGTSKPTTAPIVVIPPA